MTRLLRPPKPPSRLARNLSRHFASDFHDRERVEEERISDYDPARYCPIELGSTLEEPDTKELYTTLVKLGFGGTSTTWLCKEHKYVRADSLPALQKSTVCSQERCLQSPQSRRRVHDPQREEDIREDQIGRSRVGVFGGVILFARQNELSM